MRIGYLSSDFGVPVFGTKGASVHVRELIEAFRRAGHEVCLVSPALDLGEREGPNRFRSDGPPLLLRPLPQDPRHAELLGELERVEKLLGSRTRIRQELRNLLYNLTVYERGLEAFRAARVELVYERYTLASLAGNRVARELGVPHLLEVNAPLAWEQERMRGLEMKELARALEGRIFREADRLLVVSSALRELALGCGVPPERVFVVPNSVDPARFAAARGERESARRALGLGERCVIGFVGGLKPWHGTETLLEAFRRLRAGGGEAHVLVVGDGPAGDALRGFVAEHGLARDVTFTGAVPYTEVPRMLAAMDVAVAPYGPHENFYFSPIKLFEYMVMGKAVVAGAIGQVAEVVQDGETGRLYAPGDVEALAGVLAELAADPASRERLGARARAWALRERTWDHNAARVLEIAATFGA
jgi:glycosyltransferase involved in cell wall biosynthesis